jgi:O-antigen/teichoic acid export membrane protein
LVDIPTTLARLGLTVFLVGNTGGLVTLAWITLGTNTFSGLAKTWLSFRERPAMRIGWRSFTPTHARELMTYGIWQFVESIASLSSKSFIPAAIGGTLGPIAVVPFSLANRLVDTATMFEMTATGVVSPVSTLLHARQNLNVQRQLFILCTQYCSCLGFFFTAGFIFFGSETLTLWVGPNFAYASRYLTILAVGSTLPVAFGVVDSVLIGLSRPRLSAVISVCSAVLSICGAVIFGRHGDLTSVCVTIAISMTFFQGILKPFITGYLIDLSPLTILTQAIIPATAISSIPVAILYLMVTVHPPNSIAWLVGQSAVFGVLALASVLLGIKGSLATVRKCFVPAR